MQRLGAEVDEIESLGKIPIINDNTEITNGAEWGPTSNTINFWKQVAQFFSSQSNSSQYSNIIFDVFNEPRGITWSVWQKGGNGYVGMQDVVDAIRGSSNSLSNNLIMVEGPKVAGTLDELDQYPITGSNIAFAYHHVDFTQSASVWQGNMGLQLKTKVPIIDGEWAQYASDKAECLGPNAPKDVNNYLNTLKQNNIGLILWSLEPGVAVESNASDNKPFSNTIASYFPTTAAGYSQPNSYQSNYACITGSGGDLIDQGPGQIIMSY